MNLAAGTVIADRFRLERTLGRGGMGVVWVAHDLRLDSACAIKFLLASIDDRARARFALEAKAAAQIRSPNVVTVLDYGEADGVPYIAMELLEGEDLASRLGRLGKLSPGRALEVVEHVARALSRAHGAGLIHRDLKPGNIFLARDEEREVVKVLDFGIAKAQVTATPKDALALADTAAAPAFAMTATGVSLGTPSYMSPEQIDGLDVDARTDLWALAVVAYECLTGRLPFQSESLGRLYGLVLTATPAAPTTIAPELPAAVDAWFQRALAKDRAERFASARELADALAVALPEASRERPADAGPVDGEAATAAARLVAVFAPTVRQEATSAPDAPAADAPAPTPALVPTPSPRRSGWIVGVAALGICGIGAAALALWMRDGESSRRTRAKDVEEARSGEGAEPTSDSSGRKPKASAAVMPASASLAPFVPGSSPVVELAAGGGHTCARLASGAVTCWGRAYDGQFGERVAAMSPPLMMPGIDDATRVKAGMLSTCVLNKSRALRCFGVLGPKLKGQPSFLEDVAAFDVSVWDGICVVKPTGKVHCIAGVDANTDADGSILGLTDAVDVAVGRRHICALRRSGEVACWGAADLFQLAGKRSPPQELSPRAVAGLTEVVEVVAGPDATCARTRSGAVLCWGDAVNGQLGAKDRRTSVKISGSLSRTEFPPTMGPEAVLGIPPATQVDFGDSFACAVSSGDLRCWGSNSWGRLGFGRFGQVTFKIGSTPPPPELVAANVKQVSTGQLHACALLESGEVLCWGRNAEHQLGVETKEFCEDTTPCATRPVRAF